MTAAGNGQQYSLVITQEPIAQLKPTNAASSSASAPVAKSRRLAVRASLLAALFLVCLCWVLALLKFVGSLEDRLPGHEHQQHTTFRIPKTLPELKAFKHTLEALNTRFPPQLLAVFISVYLFIRAFMIPGSFVLNLLAGSLYPLPLAFLLVTAVSLLGDYFNYLLARYAFSSAVAWAAPRQLASFSTMVATHKGNLLFYMTFLRVLAVVPGWFINLASPLVGVRTWVFLASTLVGSIPVHLVVVNAGRTLYQLQSFRDVFGPANIAALLACAVLPLATVLIRYALKRYRQPPAPTGLPATPLMELRV